MPSYPGVNIAWFWDGVSHVVLHGSILWFNVSPGGQTHQTQALVFFISRVWVSVQVLTLVSLTS